jgi:hypothetical protein
LIQLVWVDRFYTNPIKQDFRGAAGLAAGWLRSGSAERVVCLAWNKRYFEYYLTRSGITEAPGCSSKPDAILSKLKKAGKSKRPVAFIYGHLAPSGALWNKIRSSFVVLEHHPLHKAGAALLQSK